jgi:hypothetical protein
LVAPYAEDANKLLIIHVGGPDDRHLCKSLVYAMTWEQTLTLLMLITFCSHLDTESADTPDQATPQAQEERAATPCRQSQERYNAATPLACLRERLAHRLYQARPCRAHAPQIAPARGALDLHPDIDGRPLLRYSSPEPTTDGEGVKSLPSLCSLTYLLFPHESSCERLARRGNRSYLHSGVFAHFRCCLESCYKFLCSSDRRSRERLGVGGRLDRSWDIEVALARSELSASRVCGPHTAIDQGLATQSDPLGRRMRTGSRCPRLGLQHPWTRLG